MTDIEGSSKLSDRELAARLIAAGSRERPSPHSLQRTLSALGLGTAALGASATAAGAVSTAAAAGSQVAGSFGAVTLIKFIALGAAGGLLFVTGAERLTSSSEASRRAQEPAVHSANSARARRAVEATGPAVAAQGEVLKTREIPALAPESKRPAVSAPSSSPGQRMLPSGLGPAQSSSVRLNPFLAPEIAFVDRGRSAFQRGEFAATLTLLEGYERTFTDARLLPEVLYLRMQASHQSGQARRAVDLARQLVREFPNSAHAASARAILEGSPR